jgi:hypothetical protein
MKTSELTGAALDWAVALIEFPEPDYEDDDRLVYVHGDDEFHFTPSTDWAQGGPIIEREKFTVMYDDDWKYDPTDPEDNGERWMADNGDSYYNPTQYGATPLIAAMRFYVASKMGDTIDIPKELT